LGDDLFMNRITDVLLRLRIWKDGCGQDMIEYALMAGFVAVAAIAVVPGIAPGIKVILSKVGSVTASASTQPS
jgi:Flp pilus assembly pilin Flp